MAETGSALMGIGQASGENRAADAARKAISSPLLETSIEGAKGVLLNITGGPNLTLLEVNEASRLLAKLPTKKPILFLERSSTKISKMMYGSRLSLQVSIKEILLSRNQKVNLKVPEVRITRVIMTTRLMTMWIFRVS